MRMMRRVLAISILLMLLFFASQWLVTYIKKSHDIIYDFVTEQATFQVNEGYRQELDDSYFVQISTGDFVFDYKFSNLYQKKKKIIADIKMVKNENLMCIYPILEKEDSSYNIECSRDGVLYSYEAVKGDPVVSQFVETLKKESHQSNAWEIESEEGVPSVQSYAYQKNILNKDKIIVWYYKGIEVLTADKVDQVPLLTFDKYENTHGVLVDQYYVLPIYLSDRVFDFEMVTVVDMKTLDFWTIKFPQTVSQNTYVQGVVDGKVYYLDRDHVVQYELNPEKKAVRLIGNQELNAQYYKGNDDWDTVNIYDLVNNQTKFEVDHSEPIDFKRNDIVETLENKGAFYYYTNSGDFYRVLKDFPERAMFLFHAEQPNNVILNQDSLYYISGDTLYRYEEATGRKKLVKNNEFIYNKMNRIQVYKGSKS